jgi:tRNA threonylcarbamoyladenosine modification (KEOPS) complex  Pcc1 subunit
MFFASQYFNAVNAEFLKIIYASLIARVNLEPDKRYGYAYLHATAGCVRENYHAPDLSEMQAHVNRTDSA